MHKFFINKVNDDYSDALHAYGFSFFLQSLFNKKVIIENTPSFYCIHSSVDISDKEISSLKFDWKTHNLPYLTSSGKISEKQAKLGKKEQKPVSAPEHCNYQYSLNELSDRLSTYYALLKGIPSKIRTRVDFETNETFENVRKASLSREESNILSIKGFNIAYVEAWNNTSLFVYNQSLEWHNSIKSLLTIYADEDGYNKSPVGDKFDSTQNQILSPNTPNGINSQTPRFEYHGSKQSNWVTFFEYMAFYKTAIIADSRNSQTYIFLPSPGIISVSGISSILNEIDNEKRFIVGTRNHGIINNIAVKYLVSKTLMEHIFKKMKIDSEENNAEFKSSTNYINGLYVSRLYPFSSKAKSVLGVHFDALPVAFFSNRFKEATTQLGFLKLIVDQLTRRTKYDDTRVVTLFNDYLSSYTLKELLIFLSHYLLEQAQKMNKKEFSHRINVENIKEYIKMTHKQEKLSEIFENESFLNIARAINKADFSAQYDKSKNGSSLFQPQYGLGQELINSSYNLDTFSKRLARFIYEYQTETARVSARTNLPLYRTSVREDDFKTVIEFAETFGSEVVAHALVALSYSTRKSTKNEENNKEEKED